MPKFLPSQAKGYVAVWYLDGSKRFIPRAYYEQLDAALINGKFWFHCTDLFDNPLTLRLSAVYEVVDWSIGSMLVSDEEDEQQKAELL